MQRSFTRHGVLTLDEFLPLIAVGVDYRSKVHKASLHGHSVGVCSLRLQTFALKGTRCASCGIEGSFFAIEGLRCQAHANLYAIKDGEEVLMTMDHVIPTARGGKNHINNAQTLCARCNVAKGDRVDVPPPAEEK